MVNAFLDTALLIDSKNSSPQKTHGITHIGIAFIVTRIAIFSDLHLEFGNFLPPRLDADIVVLAGDIYTKGRGTLWDNAEDVFGCPVVFVMGNHEYYGMNDRSAMIKTRAAASKKNLIFLENEETIISGIRVLGCTLWTDYRLYSGNDNNLMEKDISHCLRTMNDYRKIRIASDGYRRFQPKDALALHQASVAWLEHALREPFEGHTIIVTHHAPSLMSVPSHERNNPVMAAYASNLEWLVNASRASLWVHGHIHESVNYKIEGTHVVSNPRGYYPSDINSSFNDHLTVEI